MDNLEILYFEQLKKEVQAKYLDNHTPSHNDITKWKGIDIIYFQEDLRKYAKGNISEKSFYTYFKTSPVSKLPRIDMLNLLSNYAGYESWFNYKKLKPIALPTTEVDEPELEITPTEKTVKVVENSTMDKQATIDVIPNNLEVEKVDNNLQVQDRNDLEKSTKKEVLQINNTDNQQIETLSNVQKRNFFKKNIWYIITSVLSLSILFLIFRDQWLYKEYTYSFIDSDRNTLIKDELDVKILKENESPILIRIKPNAPFKYTTQSKTLTMIVSSPFYKTDTIKRNLETAPEKENIELKPNDYAILLYYYSRSIKDFKKKREQLNQLISDDAQITQVYDNETYAVERLDKQKYISLVTLPTTALENLNVIDTQMKNGKIVLIRFKISTNEK
ncbi:hypothetical protein SAMN05660477_02007 [Soonwooa buanensis]|uniref:Uncharacterized protein n=1 Tax=Soonwooa buanensis TaxID=619805 RepID=A0A1T5FEZ7_9FLAO|nr:hypothetical protein [Soonwooa buanensis]SKB94741.1 hypothetical protein SAMN05660477_02007 [Soonwooa buanensis]